MSNKTLLITLAQPEPDQTETFHGYVAAPNPDATADLHAYQAGSGPIFARHGARPGAQLPVSGRPIGNTPPPSSPSSSFPPLKQPRPSSRIPTIRPWSPPAIADSPHSTSTSRPDHPDTNHKD